jgi:hypothetical protein
MKVTVCAPAEVQEGIQGRIDQSQLNRLFRKRDYAYRSLLACLFDQWDKVILSYRPLEAKNEPHHIKGLISELLFKAVFLLVVVLTPKRSNIIFDCHQIKSWTRRTIKSKHRTLRFVEKIGKRYIENRVDTIFVYDWPIKDRLVKDIEGNKTKSANKDIVVVPALVGTRIENGAEAQKKYLLQIVVPGRIDHRRRDYSWIDIISRQYREFIKIDLLGRARTRSDREFVKSIGELGYQIDGRVRGEFVQQAEFDEICWSADIFLAPVITKFGDRQIGEDTISGAMWDAIFYKKPLILPVDATVGAIYETSIIRYSSNTELASLICRLVEDNEMLSNFRRRVDQTVDNLERQRDSFKEQLVQLRIEH